MPTRPILRRTARRLLLLALALGPAGSLLSAPSAHADTPAESVRTIDIVVDGAYRPARIEVRQGEHVRLRFVRRDYGPCTREVVFPELGIRRTLPTNEAVVVDLPALAPGEYDFHCGMHMIHGLLVVSAS